MSPIVAVDDSAAQAPDGGSGFTRLVDTASLTQELRDKNQGLKNREETQPYRDYMKRVIQAAGVRDTRLTRELVSNICSTVAKLPFIPDRDEIVVPKTGNAPAKTEWDLQVERTAEQAQTALGDQAPVMIVAARKLTLKALELRAQDPDGTRNIAWVNDPLPGEDGEEVHNELPSALTGGMTTGDSPTE